MEHPVTCLATVSYVYATRAGCVTIFSTGGKIPVGLELHTLTLAARCYIEQSMPRQYA